MSFESLFFSVRDFMYSLSPMELVLITPFIIGAWVVSVLGICLAIIFYRWTLRNEDEESKKGR